MLTFVYYLLKVSLCSSLLFSYYFFVLRNKQFHQYNRFYLLSSVILSFIIPSVKIEFWNIEAEQQMPAVKLLNVMVTQDAVVKESLKLTPETWNFNSIAFVVFSLVSTALLVGFILGLIRIVKLTRSSTHRRWNNIKIIFTETRGTPFSFLKYIFWNKNIDIEDSEGKHVLQHELVHVYEKHSLDKLFLNIVLIIGWANPFFWLIRSELSMVHEFIADKKAVSNGDAQSFSAMLLKAAYPQHSFTLTNSFFHSPIKRRLIMFMTSKKPAYSYLRRLMALPMLSFLIVFFAFQSEGQDSNKLQNSQVKDSVGKLKEINVTNEISKDSTIRIEGTDTAIKIKDGAGRIIKWLTHDPINTKTNYTDTSALPKPLVILDGVKMSWEDFQKKNILTERIRVINVLKDKPAIEKYGKTGTNGVLEVITKGIVDLSLDEKPKNKYQDSTEPQFQRVFTRVENPPYYAKGMAAFATYIQNAVQYPKEAIENKKEGAVSIQFIVDENGNLSDFKKASDVGFGLEEEAVRLLKNSTDWKPGTQNGHKVPVQIVQQVTFSLPSKKG